jgi:hypothetical protein
MTTTGTSPQARAVYANQGFPIDGRDDRRRLLSHAVVSASRGKAHDVASTSVRSSGTVAFARSIEAKNWA